MTIPRTPHDNQGFSLIEALIAATILATAAVSLAQLLGSGLRATADAGRMTRASLLAAAKLEELRAARLDATGLAAADTPEPGFAREWTLAPLPEDPTALCLADVIVQTSSGITRMLAVVPRTSP